ANRDLSGRPRIISFSKGLAHEIFIGYCHANFCPIKERADLTRRACYCQSDPSGPTHLRWVPRAGRAFYYPFILNRASNSSRDNPEKPSTTRSASKSLSLG